MKVEIINIENEKWNTLIKQSVIYDFYHFKSYHLLEKDHSPILFVLYLNDKFLALPMLKRRISGTAYYDCTSVYGYCGPISNMPFSDISSEHINYFQSELNKYFLTNNIISAFNRLHPIIESDNIFKNFGIIKNLNKTVYIDLKIEDQAQLKQFRKSIKYDIKKLRNSGFRVESSKTYEDITRYVELYLLNMKRLNADREYYFNQEYFLNFLKKSDFKTKLLIAKKNNVITAGAIFTFTPKIIQYHLAATNSLFYHFAPMKLILDEARMIGNELKSSFLHLGGGVGGSDEDSLFNFKAGFSNLRLRYKVWQFIANKDVYDSLTKEMKKSHIFHDDYFPAYRAK